MNTTTARRTAALAALTIAATITTVAAPTKAIDDPPTDRPCFITQPRWNVALDGPAPTCPIDARDRKRGEDAVPDARPGTDFGV